MHGFRYQAWLGLSTIVTLLSQCGRDCRRFSQGVNQVQRTLELLAYGCGGLAFIAGVGGALAATVKNLRAPTRTSRFLGGGLGSVNTIVGGLLALSAVDANELGSLLGVLAAGGVWCAFGVAVVAVAVRAKPRS